MTVKRDAASFSQQYTVEDLRTAAIIIRRENTLVPPDIIDFMEEAAVEKLKEIRTK